MRVALRRILALLLLLSAAAQAQLSIEITGAGANRIPIAIADFSGEAALARALSSVIRADLDRSGLFQLVDAGPLAISDKVAVSYGDWKAKSADAFVAGSLVATKDGRYEASFRLYDVNRQSVLTSGAYAASADSLRRMAHIIADDIYEKLIGEPGIFSTRIAYVVKVGARYDLQIADADGQNPGVALTSREPIISPSWSPDGSRLAYVSFEQKKPIVYVHSLASVKRHVVANFKGSNSAPAWSPDGRRMAVVLTKDGGSQLYLINADGSGGAQRLMSSPGIDTEPRFSPDGQWIYFTSDRGGSPQIYRIAATGGSAERITFEGSYNVTPRPSPDGKSLAYIARNGGRFQLAIMDLATKQVQILTDSNKDESPSFAPNGRMIVIATEVGGRGILSAVSADGRIKYRLSGVAGDVREPAWGPFVK